MLKLNVLLPVGLLMLQTFILLFICLTILKRLKLLKMPYAGMEYGELIIAAVFLLGVFIINVADGAGLFQAYKIFQNSNEKVFLNTFYKFSQFFIVILFFEILFGLTAAFVIKLVLGFKNSLESIRQGNLPAAMLVAVIALGFAILLQLCAREVIEYITPEYLNFR